MTIDEAVEMMKSDSETSIGQDFIARSILANEYLRLTDPTPLTRELIEAELGSCTDYENVWSVNQSYVRWCPVFKRATTHGLSVSTLGHLRQTVAMLRGGGA